MSATTEWVRNETYKLYVGNRFYNIKNDPNEKNSMPINEMTDQEKMIRKEFIEA